MNNINPLFCERELESLRTFIKHFEMVLHKKVLLYIHTIKWFNILLQIEENVLYSQYVFCTYKLNTLWINKTTRHKGIENTI